jgi:hypothetical protein
MSQRWAAWLMGQRWAAWLMSQPHGSSAMWRLLRHVPADDGSSAEPKPARFHAIQAATLRPGAPRRSFPKEKAPDFSREFLEKNQSGYALIRLLRPMLEIALCLGVDSVVAWGSAIETHSRYFWCWASWGRSNPCNDNICNNIYINIMTIFQTAWLWSFWCGFHQGRHSTCPRNSSGYLKTLTQVTSSPFFRHRNFPLTPVYLTAPNDVRGPLRRRLSAECQICRDTLNKRYMRLFVNPFHGAVDAHYRAVYISAKSQDGPEDHKAIDTTPLHWAVSFNCDVAAAATVAAFAAANAWPPFDFSISVPWQLATFGRWFSPQLFSGRPTTVSGLRAVPFHFGPQIAVLRLLGSLFLFATREFHDFSSVSLILQTLNSRRWWSGHCWLWLRNRSDDVTLCLLSPDERIYDLPQF